mgnify:CR=1 FL=1
MRRLKRFLLRSRRRHTRWPREWGSVVGSSDQVAFRAEFPVEFRAEFELKVEFELRVEFLGDRKIACRERV